MGYEFNPYYFERTATDRDYNMVQEFTSKLRKTLDEMSSVDEVVNLIDFFKAKGGSYYPPFLQSMCNAAFVAACSLAHCQFVTDRSQASFPDWEEYKLNVPNYIFVREFKKFPHVVQKPAQRKNNLDLLFKLYLESFRSIYSTTNRIYYEIFSAVLRISGIRILIHDQCRGLEFKVVDGRSLLYKGLSKDGSNIEILD